MVLDPQTHFGHSFAEVMKTEGKVISFRDQVVYDVQTFEISWRVVVFYKWCCPERVNFTTGLNTTQVPIFPSSKTLYTCRSLSQKMHLSAITKHWPLQHPHPQHHHHIPFFCVNSFLTHSNFVQSPTIISNSAEWFQQQLMLDILTSNTWTLFHNSLLKSWGSSSSSSSVAHDQSKSHTTQMISAIATKVTELHPSLACEGWQLFAFLASFQLSLG